MKTRCSAKSSQRGAVFALFVIGLLAIIAIAGLALDMSHAYVDKTRLQNALDAAALSGAMTVINSNGNCDTARGHAIDTFYENVSGTELEDLTPTIEFSEVLAKNAFSESCPDSPSFVRAKLRGDNRFGMTTWLARILGEQYKTLAIGASAVAGTVDIIPCKVGPFVVCGDEPSGCDNPNDCFGYKVTGGDTGIAAEECYLKVGSGGDPLDSKDPPEGQVCGIDPQWKDSQVGPGNYHFKQYESCSKSNGKGKPCMVESLGAGAIDQCDEANNTYVDTQTGNIVSIRDAFNTIFDLPGSDGKKYPDDEFPPDTDTREDIFYDQYTGNGRRVMPVVIARCDADPDNECANSDYAFKGDADKGKTPSGTTCLPKLTVGCFFLTRSLPSPKNKDGEKATGKTSVVYGQFIGKCPSYGSPTQNPSLFDIQKIILYDDPDSVDS